MPFNVLASLLLLAPPQPRPAAATPQLLVPAIVFQGQRFHVGCSVSGRSPSKVSLVPVDTYLKSPQAPGTALSLRDGTVTIPTNMRIGTYVVVSSQSGVGPGLLFVTELRVGNGNNPIIKGKG